MSFSRRNVTKRSDYSKKRAPVSNDHEGTSDPKEIILPTMASPVACKKNRKAKSINFQRENSARGLRSTPRREKRVSRGLGLGIYRETTKSVPREGLGFSYRTARVMMEARKEEIQFDFPKRPRTKRQRQSDGDSDYVASPRSNLKVVFDSATQKHSLVSGGMTLSPINSKSRRPSMIFRRSPSFNIEDESFRTASSPISVIDDLSIHWSPTKSKVTMSPEDRNKLRVPLNSTHTRIVFSSSFHIECECLSAMTATPKVISPVETEKVQSPSPSAKPKRLCEAPAPAPALRRRGKRIQDLITKLGITG
jgi:hypothetical protein